MPKRKKVLPARRQRDRTDEESLLMRSAESLGRMIGSLQRQLDGASKRLSERADDVMNIIPGEKKKKTATRKRTARKSATSARKTGQSRTRTATRSSKKR